MTLFCLILEAKVTETAGLGRKYNSQKTGRWYSIKCGIYAIAGKKNKFPELLFHFNYSALWLKYIAGVGYGYELGLQTQLYCAEHVHITKTRMRIPTPFFCIEQESESVSESGNVFQPSHK